MKKLIILAILLIPFLAFAEWSQPVWTDDCTVTVEKDQNGRVKTWIEICCGEDGKQTSKRVESYTYYGTDEINEINQKIYNSKNTKVSEKKVKHFTDGKQPTVSNISVIEGDIPK